MDIFKLFSLQGTLFVMMLVGAWMKQRGIIDENGKKCLNTLCVDIIIPCSVFNAFLIEFDWNIFKDCSVLLLSSVVIQILCLLLNKWVFNRYPPQRKKIMQYCTIVPMSGFLGHPIAEAIYGHIGVLYASFFLIPMRIVMWSIGTSYFVADASIDTKHVLKNVLTNPCLIAIYFGMFFMVTQIPLPSVVTEAFRYIGSCNSAISMFIMGTILADVKLPTICNKDTIFFSIIRLLILPALALGIGTILKLDSTSLGISVLMAGMPAGVTAVIFSARYKSDTLFATKCVVMTMLVSMITIPIWCYGIGR